MELKAKPSGSQSMAETPTRRPLVETAYLISL